MTTKIRPTKDEATVTAKGELLRPVIEGVVIRPQSSIEDERGEVIEVYRPAWNVHPDSLVYVYQVMIRPGKVKGWTLHEKQDDRLFLVRGSLLWALYDDRPDSPTRGVLQTQVVSERNKCLLIIPRSVYHAVQNIGQEEALFINMPTRPYDHGDPDKFRLPVQNDLIPFDFDTGLGW
jgi:dTDP-4-dehydrorhamnose 3,5-epimerase